MDDDDWSPRSLDEVRERIDAIDDAVLALLHDRAHVVEHVGRLKREGGGTGANSAFRPAREVAMLRSLYARTRDPLTFTTVAAVWREIISGFTAAQVSLPIRTMAETATLARETFGAQALISLAPSPAECLSAVTRTPGTVALLPADGIDWRSVAESGGKIVAAAPFVGTEIEAWCVTLGEPGESGEDMTLAMAPDGTIRHIPGIHTDLADETFIGAYPVPLKTGRS